MVSTSGGACSFTLLRLVSPICGTGRIPAQGGEGVGRGCGECSGSKTLGRGQGTNAQAGGRSAENGFGRQIGCFPLYPSGFWVVFEENEDEDENEEEGNAATDRLRQVLSFPVRILLLVRLRCVRRLGLSCH